MSVDRPPGGARRAPGGGVFVTGATGLLGTALLPRLRAAGFDVTALTRAAPGETAGSAERGGAGFVRGDLGQPATYRESLEQCRSVVHLAALTGKAPAGRYFEVNVEGTRRLLAACAEAGVERFLFASSIAVRFGDLDRYPYARSKVRAEELVASSGLRWTVVRPTIILGPGSPALEAFTRLATLPLLPIFGSGRVRVQPISVDDLADLVVEIVAGESFERTTLELGGPEVVSIEQLMRTIRRLVGRGAARAIHLPLRPLVALLAALEPVALPILPFTAGQLSTFRYDATIESNPLHASRRAGLQGVEEMLRASLRP